MAVAFSLSHRPAEAGPTRRRDLPDLVSFMLATGARIAETLAVLGPEADLDKRHGADHLDDGPRQRPVVADQLGPARPSMTQDVYMARRVKNSKAAEALEFMLGDEPNEKRG